MDATHAEIRALVHEIMEDKDKSWRFKKEVTAGNAVSFILLLAMVFGLYINLVRGIDHNASSVSILDSRFTTHETNQRIIERSRDNSYAKILDKLDSLSAKMNEIIGRNDK